MNNTPDDTDTHAYVLTPGDDVVAVTRARDATSS